MSRRRVIRRMSKEPERRRWRRERRNGDSGAVGGDSISPSVAAAPAFPQLFVKLLSHAFPCKAAPPDARLGVVVNHETAVPASDLFVGGKYLHLSASFRARSYLECRRPHVGGAGISVQHGEIRVDILFTPRLERSITFRDSALRDKPRTGCISINKNREYDNRKKQAGNPPFFRSLSVGGSTGGNCVYGFRGVWVVV